MSMPHSTVFCTGCDYKKGLASRSITLRYQLPNGAVAEGYRLSAWCKSCDGIVDAEALFDRDKIQAELSRIEAERPSWLVRLICRMLGGKDTSREERAGYEARLEFLRLRKSGPRCLACGGHELELLKLDGSGTPHACGGMLKVKAPDPRAPRFFYGEGVVSMDVEGNRLQQDV